MSVDEVGRVAIRGAEPAPRPPTEHPVAGLAVETPVFGRRPETLRAEGSASEDTAGRRQERAFERRGAGFEPVEYPDPSPSLPPPPVPITELPRPAAADGLRDATAAELARRPGGLEEPGRPGPGNVGRGPGAGPEPSGAARAGAPVGLAEADALARAALGRQSGPEPLRPVDPSLAGSRLDARA